ncbi:hypothetical protein [Metabacillus malikii]|nr:hypothetical protein [Metabacillus malikii]
MREPKSGIVLHKGYEYMKTKMREIKIGNVLHKGYEDQNERTKGQKWSS